MFERLESLRNLPGVLLRSRNRVIVALATLALLAGQIQPAEAYVLDGWCRWSHASGQLLSLSYTWGPNIDAQNPGGPSWRTAFTAAVWDWNGTATQVYIYPYGGQFTFDTYYAADGTYGHMAWMTRDIFSHCTSMAPQGNLQNPHTDFVGEHTAGHEIGHGFPLAHSNYNNALMTGYLNYVGVPQSDDINGVNAMYP
jgi:hypothetical protein